MQATSEPTVQTKAHTASPPISTNGHAIQVPPMDEYNMDLIANVHPPTWQNPTPSGRYNLVVIGGGSAGLVAAAGAAGLGAKVALIEKHLIGGDCLNVGCLPSKAIIRPAKVMGQIMEADKYGIHVPAGATVDFAQVMRRMRRVRAEVSHHDSAQRFTDLGVDVYFGGGQFIGPDSIEVVSEHGNRTLQFKKALISTGSRPMHLPIPGLAETGYLTNETVFELTERPPRLAVIGAGPIGAELAQAFRRFGSEVTIFDIIPRLLGREDEEAAAVVRTVFEAEGIGLALGAQTKEIRPDGAEKVIVYELNGQPHEARFDEILVAAGRVPNIDNLNLEAAGVEYHKKGVTVQETLQTTNPNIYAAGDIAFKYQFTHTADATARMVLQNALFPGPKKKLGDLIVPWATYTSPEVAHVGLYEHDAKEQGIAVQTIVQSIGDTDRGRADGETNGFVKVHIKKGTDKILGATIVASHAGDLISEITLAMNAGVGLKTIGNTIHPYPTQAEAIRKVADAYNRTRLTPLVHGLFKRWLAWTR
ncbi:MAG: mercuric reductase [Caldilineaceae bacterium]|nr:mercuric reductase [Caldilineaceae bacterium]